MAYETIIVKKEDGVATVVLNRPQVLNAVNHQMFVELNRALDEVDADDGVRVMVLTGAGRAFCASVDIKEKRGNKDRLLEDVGIEDVRRYCRSYPQRITRGIVNLQKPTIAMVNGLAVGDGFDWVLACDLRVGSTAARFANAVVGLGLVSNTGATWFYPRHMGLGKAFELLYTGAWLEAEEAYRIGLLNKLTQPEDLEKETMALARKIAKQAPVAVRLTKMNVYRGLEMDLDAALELAADGEAMTLKTEDHREAMAAFLEKREPKFKGR